MKNYERPIITVNEEYAEGVYAASGDTCYALNVDLQGPYNNQYYVTMSAPHKTEGDAAHESAGLVITLTFNKNVNYLRVHGNGDNGIAPTSVTGSGTDTLTVRYDVSVSAMQYSLYLGQLAVEAEDGLTVKAVLDCLS